MWDGKIENSTDRGERGILSPTICCSTFVECLTTNSFYYGYFQRNLQFKTNDFRKKLSLN